MNKHKIKDRLLKEIDDVLSTQSKNLKRQAIQADIKELSQRIIDKKKELSQIRF